MNYAKLDKSIRFNYRKDIEVIVNELGYTYITETYYKIYKITGSLNQTGFILGITGNATRYVLNKMGAKINGRGGPNNYKKGFQVSAPPKKKERMDEMIKSGFT